jgi:hypothetical protein
MSLRKFLFPLIVLLLAHGVCWSQITTGTMRGVVNDPDGKPVPGATVTITSPALIGGSKVAYTNELGVFRFPSLPVGTYSVEVALEGFQKVQVTKVNVGLGVAADVPLTMKMAGRTEDVEVLGEAPLIDVTQSGLSTNYSKEILQNTPTQRSFYNLMQVAPGISQSYGDSASDRTIAFGSNMQSNSWNVDGLETTAPETGSTWLYQAPDSIDEIQVIGVGAPAEYGNHQGAVFNVVTKKGGNTVHGTANFLFQDNSLTGSNVKLPACSDALTPGTACADLAAGADPEFHRIQYHDASGTIGGPVVKDKLWFFGSVQNMRDNITQPANDPNNAFPYKQDAYDGKLSGLLGEKNEWTGFYHFENWNNGGSSPFSTPTALYDERGKNHSWGGGVTSTLSNNFMVEAHYAGWNTRDLQNSVQPNTLDPFYDETPPGGGPYVYSGGVTYPFDYVTSRHQVNGKATYYAQNFLKSQHEFRFGVQWSRGLADTLTAAGANGFYTYNYYGYLYRVYQEPYRYGAITHDMGTFLDDTVTVTPRLTLNLGVRYDHNSGDIPPFQNLAVGTPSITEVGNWITVPGESPGIHAMTWNTVSPRLGFVLQTREGGKSTLNGSFGVYYDHNVSGNWDFPSPAVTPYQLWTFDPVLGKQDLVFQQNYNNAIDPNVKPPKTLQYALGYDHQLSDNVAVGIQYVYKDTTDLIGWQINGGSWAPTTFTDPFTGKTYTLLNLVDNPTLQKSNSVGDFCDHIIGGGTASMCDQNLSYFQKYHGVVLTFTKKFSNNWALNASYTWSHSYGLNPRPLEQNQFNPFYGSTREADPNAWLNAYGNLQGDRPNMIRAQGVFNNLPWGLTSAVNFDFDNGRPFTRQFSVPLDQGHRRVIMDRDLQNPWFKTIDLTIGKRFPITKGAYAQVNATIYNLLNSSAILDYESLVLSEGEVFTPLDWTKPRRLQIQTMLQF